MTQLLPDDLASVPMAKLTRAMRDLVGGLKKNTMAAAVVCAHVCHLERWKELKGCTSFSDWCERVGLSRQWGSDLVKSAEMSAIADNVGQAKILLGLTQEQATEVKASAEERGPVTARTLREERERIESASVDDVRQAREKVLGRAREVNRGATDEQVERRAPKIIRKLLELLRQHSGTPEQHLDYCETMLEYWGQQAELSRAA